MHARTPYAYYTVNVYCSQRCQRLQCARIIITWYTLNVLLRTILLETRFVQYDQRTHSLYQPASYYDCVICVSIVSAIDVARAAPSSVWQRPSCGAARGRVITVLSSVRNVYVFFVVLSPILLLRTWRLRKKTEKSTHEADRAFNGRKGIELFVNDSVSKEREWM